VKHSPRHAEGVTILERSDHLEMAQDRLEKCMWSPTVKRVAAYLTPVWGDIPANSEWISLPGQAVAGGKDAGPIER